MTESEDRARAFFEDMRARAEAGQMILAKLAVAFYRDEPCRICGELIGDDPNPIYVGYSQDRTSRAAHEQCFRNLSADEVEALKAEEKKCE